MALVNPQIAMSYRPTVEYQPRNALAEYAQIQNIIGGQRQAEVAEMQLDQLRQDRDALRQIQAAIVEKGGPPDLGAAADAMIRSGRPQYIQQGLTIRDTLRKQKLLEDYEREYYPTDAATPSAVPAAAAAAPAAAAPVAAAPAAAAPAEGAVNALAPAAAAAEGAVNALAPATAAPATTNAMRAAAQPDVNALMRRYNQAARAGSPDAPAILKQIEAALRGDQSTKVSPGEVVINRSGQVIYTAPAAPSAIGAIEAEIAALKGQGVADTDPRIVARQGKIRQLSGAPGPTEIANIEAEIATLKAQGVADTDPRIVARQGKIRQLSGAPGPTEIANIEAEIATLKAQGVADTDPRIVARQGKIRQLSGAPGPTEIAVLETEIAALKAQGAADTDPRIVTRQGKITQLSGGPAPAEIRTMQSLGYPLTQAGYASFRAAQMRETQQQPPALVPILRDGKPVLVPREEAVGQTPFSPASVQVLGVGPQREAPAPTITQIQDPTDPSRMITIDARRYQGGGVGSPGVIGASGKSAPAQAAAVKQEQGLTKADDILTQLQSAYAQLKERKAIPSEQTSALTNIWASIAASGVGQVAGRAVGTAAQTQRDIIQSSRNQLLLAIKDATGLSAQQLNSNMELQTWLSSLTDPTRSIEANEAILQNVRKFIDSGGKYTARGGAGAGATPTPAGRGAATGGRDLGNGFKLVD